MIDSLDHLQIQLGVIHDQLQVTVKELNAKGAIVDAANFEEARAQAYRMLSTLISMRNLLIADFQRLNSSVESMLPRLAELDKQFKNTSGNEQEEKKMGDKDIPEFQHPGREMTQQ
jgi:hypothetical protein